MAMLPRNHDMPKAALYMPKAVPLLPAGVMSATTALMTESCAPKPTPYNIMPSMTNVTSLENIRKTNRGTAAKTHMSGSRPTRSYDLPNANADRPSDAMTIAYITGTHPSETPANRSMCSAISGKSA